MIGTSAELINYYKEAFCFLSTSRWEGLPLAIMEAMSFGVPVVASDVPGNSDLIEHNQTGLLFNIRNPEEAAAHLLLLFENKVTWRKFSSASKEKIRKNFSAARMAEETGNLYYKILPYPNYPIES
jgi:glycosyltransferase involved in cell wall biosynthesis